MIGEIDVNDLLSTAMLGVTLIRSSCLARCASAR